MCRWKLSGHPLCLKPSLPANQLKCLRKYLSQRRMILRWMIKRMKRNLPNYTKSYPQQSKKSHRLLSRSKIRQFSTKQHHSRLMKYKNGRLRLAQLSLAGSFQRVPLTAAIPVSSQSARRRAPASRRLHRLRSAISKTLEWWARFSSKSALPWSFSR